MQPSFPPPVPPVAPVYTPTNHTFHLLLSLVTCGVWLFVWPFVAALNAYQNNRSRRAYEVARATYQQALWAHQEAERMHRDLHPRAGSGPAVLPATAPGPSRVTWAENDPQEGRYGDPRAGYRPATTTSSGVSMACGDCQKGVCPVHNPYPQYLPGRVPRWTSGTPAVPPAPPAGPVS